MDDDEKAMVAEANANGQPAAAAGAGVRMEDDEDEEPMKIVKDYQRPVARHIPFLCSIHH